MDRSQVNPHSTIPSHPHLHAVRPSRTGNVGNDGSPSSRNELYSLLNDERWRHSLTIQALRRKRDEAAALQEKLDEVEAFYRRAADGWRECFDDLVEANETQQSLRDELEVKDGELEKLQVLEVWARIHHTLNKADAMNSEARSRLVSSSAWHRRRTGR